MLQSLSMPSSVPPVPASAAETTVVVDYHPAGNADVVTVFSLSKAKLRLVVYALLMALDLLAGAAAWTTGLADAVLAPAQALLFGLLAPLLHAYGLDGLERPHTGAWRAGLAAATATGMAALLARTLGRPGASIAATCAVGAVLALAVAATRLAALPLLRRVLREPTNDLVLVAGEPSRPFATGTVVDAGALAIESGPGNVDALNRLGHLVRNSDRVIVDVPTAHRARWAELLQGAHVPVTWAEDLAEKVPPTTLPLESRAAKRALDLALVLAALPLALPLMAALALAIRLDTSGPVFFCQWRVGRGNRQFEILKFRTMRHGTVDRLGHRSAQRGDARVTRLGRFLRATSLDELPQLFNVLGGSMSIVGPRPHPLGCRAEDVLFWHIDAGYAQRHVVKPGLTGLAQVRGFRGATHTTADLLNRLRADQEYIANWSLLGDLAIVARTVAVLIHPNAY